MQKTNYNYIETTNANLFLWTKGVQAEESAIAQLKDVAQMPFIFKHIAAMPDIHAGKGSTIGSVFATQKAIIPAAIGVDIGCGVIAQRTNLRKSDFPSDLSIVRSAIESVVPHGRTDNGLENDVGKFKKLPETHKRRWDSLKDEYNELVREYPQLKGLSDVSLMIGTLGGGNHFLELAEDELGRVWILVHSGSRGAGAKIGGTFVKWAQEEMEKYFILDKLPNKDLSYLVEGTDLFKGYMKAVNWAQKYATQNREAMVEATFNALKGFCPNAQLSEDVINCHHNYITKENHFGSNVWVTRKGSLCARAGMKVVIPGSMGKRTYIGIGKGNPHSFNSCSHGAGRAMSRSEARKRFTIEQHKEAMAGIEARTDHGILDETPMAYKDIDMVMAAQSDLVEVAHTLCQFLNIKG
ncbi:RtcB family protein [Vibrio sp. D431a]|uniref:RtcB family protein n=1 Tax=Vibrio sp. D431a TaxID=2837388 RepID=UPI0025545AF8|nr:RtcB family protein [Vibrio sp. D431a]MDK9790008.1 RtcB family protein [Vibrio sp. D431a]